MPLILLATPDDLALFGYDSSDATQLAKASVRVYGYLRTRASAVNALDPDTETPVELREVVCAIAHRFAQSPAALVMGVRSQQTDGEQVTWGSEAQSGLTDLMQSEKDSLDRLYPRGVGTIDLI